MTTPPSSDASPVAPDATRDGSVTSGGFVREFLTGGFERSVPASLIPAFRGFFAAHIWLQSLKLGWIYPSNSTVLAVQVSLFLAALISLHRKYYAVGLVVLVTYKLWWVQSRFPMTGNHGYAEALILLLLLFFPDRPTDSEDPTQRVSYSCHLIQLTILSIYFYSGVQKILHGFWLDGEFVAHSLYTDLTEGFWYNMQVLTRYLDGVFGGSLGALPLARPEGLQSMLVELPGWTLAFFLLMSWAAVLSEVVAPVLVGLERTRRLGLPAMVLVQAGIGLLSLETEFMFAAMGCLMLFFHRAPRRNYLLLLAAHVLWTIAVLNSGSRLWTL